jgi:hypothetical protein
MMAWKALGAGLVAAGTAVLVMTGPADAQQKIRGVAEVQYQKLSRLRPVDDVEWWLTTFQLDYSNRIRKTLELSTQLQFTEQRYVGRPDRQRTPLVTVRLAHPLFGVFGTFRPLAVTDSRNFRTEQQQLTLSGYFQKAGLPRLTGSWDRNHQDPSGRFPGSVAVRRSAPATYDLGHLNLHAGYNDQTRRDEVGGGASGREDNYNLGSALRFDGRKSNASLQYDFNRAQRRFGGASNVLTRMHQASVNAGRQLSPRTAASLAYSFRRVDATTPGIPAQTEHDGVVNLVHHPLRFLQVSGGGGVQSVNVGSQRETESYVDASISADGEARPGWRLGSALSHSWNWLPGDRPRPIDSFRSNTRMKLTAGLEAFGDLTVSRTNRAVATTDTVTSATQVIVQSGAGLRAIPLRTLTLDASMRRYRAGATLRADGRATSSYIASLNWRRSEKLVVNGTWTRAGGFYLNTPDRTTVQGSFQWTPTRAVQASGSYTRSNQLVRDASTALTANREAYGGWLAVALNRDLRATFRYTAADPGQPTRSRQVNVTVTQSFWR